MKVHTELCIDLKTKLQNDVVMKPRKNYLGILRRDTTNDDYGFENRHCTFIETPPLTVGKRNPHVFNGRYITVTRRDDNSLRLNFKKLEVDDNFRVNDYAIGVCNELKVALTGLVEKKPTEKNE